jgi:predicted TIM-barrel fold metal-dependent hydrolase
MRNATRRYRETMTTTPPACPGPDPQPRAPRRFIVPKGAVDSHAHVIGLPPQYPFVANRAYTPPGASAAEYLSMLDRTGMTYGVLVQISVHGTDNRLLMETLAANRARLKGVAVASLDQPERAYDALRAGGVVGLRINTAHRGGAGLDVLDHYGDLCAEMAWHLQILVQAEELPALAPRLAKLPIPVVIDHMGLVPGSEGVKHPGFQALLGLVEDGAWVKLSGAFRLAGPAARYEETAPLARALLEAAPERCVWGSDWPHVATWDEMPNVGELLDLFAAWVPDAATRHRVLVENPHLLYGF